MKIKYFSTIIYLLLFGLIIGCESNGDLKSDTYVVATDSTLPPMSFMSVGNDIIGFEPDLIRVIADRTGFNVHLVNVEWAGLFGGLITKKFDMVISSVTVLEERKQRMSFSMPYLKSGLTLVVHKDQKNALIGAQVGTTSYYFLKKESLVRTKGYQMYGHAITDMVNGKIDAVLGESSGTLFFKNKLIFQEIKMVGDILSDEFYSIVFRKDDTPLMGQVNSALKELIEDGTVAQLHKKWNLGQAAQVP
jgi:arginine/lysine/histidine/glutamine transport system substrate-binding/permease protein